MALVGIAFFGRETYVGFDVTGKVGEFFVGVDLVFGTLAIAQDGLRGVLIIPEIRVGYAGF